MNTHKLNMLREIANLAHQLVHDEINKAKIYAKLKHVVTTVIDKQFENSLTLDDIGSFDVEKLRVKGNVFWAMVNGKPYDGEFTVDVDLREHTCQLDGMVIYTDAGTVDDVILEMALSEEIQAHIDDNGGDYEADAMGAAIDRACDQMEDR